LATVTDIWNVVEPYLAAERLELDDLELSGSGKGRFLRVVIDGDNLGVDRLADVSHGISRLLDDQTDLQDSYQLEVTSPGLERKLRRPSHFTKSIGREVTLKVKEGEVNRTVRGVISAAGDDKFTVESDGQILDLPYVDVLAAKTVFRWEKAPKPGH
jgi:ribosome maturation factor RimP